MLYCTVKHDMEKKTTVSVKLDARNILAHALTVGESLSVKYFCETPSE